MITKRNGGYMRRGVLHNPHKSFWTQVLKFGDKMEFFHFLSMS